MIENIKKELQILTWIKKILEIKKFFFVVKQKKKGFFDQNFFLMWNFLWWEIFFLLKKEKFFPYWKKFRSKQKIYSIFAWKEKKRSSIFAWIKQFRQEKNFFLEKQIFFWWEIQKNFYLLKKLFSSRILLVVEKKWS